MLLSMGGMCMLRMSLHVWCVDVEEHVLGGEAGDSKMFFCDLGVVVWVVFMYQSTFVCIVLQFVDWLIRDSGEFFVYPYFNPTIAFVGW